MKRTRRSRTITAFRILLSPMKSATNELQGSLYMSVGVPICCMRPSLITTIVSESVSASS